MGIQDNLTLLAKTWIYFTPYVCTERIFDSRPFHTDPVWNRLVQKVRNKNFRKRNIFKAYHVFLIMDYLSLVFFSIDKNTFFVPTLRVGKYVISQILQFFIDFRPFLAWKWHISQAVATCRKKTKSELIEHICSLGSLWCIDLRDVERCTFCSSIFHFVILDFLSK